MTEEVDSADENLEMCAGWSHPPHAAADLIEVECFPLIPSILDRSPRQRLCSECIGRRSEAVERNQIC